MKQKNTHNSKASEIGYAIKSDTGGLCQENHGHGWNIVVFEKPYQLKEYLKLNYRSSVKPIKVRITEV